MKLILRSRKHVLMYVILVTCRDGAWQRSPPLPAGSAKRFSGVVADLPDLPYLSERSKLLLRIEQGKALYVKGRSTPLLIHDSTVSLA